MGEGKHRKPDKYLINYRDSRTLKFMAYCTAFVCLLLWFFHKFTKVFPTIQQVLLGNQRAQILKDLESEGFIFVLTHYPVTALCLFIGLLMLIYLSIFIYLRKCTDYFGGKKEGKWALFSYDY